MKQKEFKQIDLTGKVYGEFDLKEIRENKVFPKKIRFFFCLIDNLKKAERGEMVKFTGQTYLMKVTDDLKTSV